GVVGRMAWAEILDRVGGGALVEGEAAQAEGRHLPAGQVVVASIRAAGEVEEGEVVDDGGRRLHHQAAGRAGPDDRVGGPRGVGAAVVAAVLGRDEEGDPTLDGAGVGHDQIV